MIDEKKLMKEMRYLKSVIRHNPAIDEIIKLIKQQEVVGEWIPVSERLPNEEEFIGAYLRSIYAAEFIVMIKGASKPTTLYFTRSGKWFDEKRNTYDVIAWQPLPEPYQNDEQEEKR